MTPTGSRDRGRDQQVACARPRVQWEKLMVAMQSIAVDALKPDARNARTHSRKQIRQIADSITAFGFVVPIVIDEVNNIIAGGGGYASAVLLCLQEVPDILM